MPDLYQPNTRIPELNGLANGVTIVLHHPGEIE